MLKLYDRDHNFIGRILKYADCKKESEVSTGDATLSFTYLAGTFDIQNEFYVQTKDAEYVVKEVSGSRSKGQSIVAVLNLEDLEQNAFQEFSVTDTTIDAAARLLLAGTGWIVGECTVTKRRNAGMRQVDARQGILKLCAAFMCEPVFDTKKKTVSFYSEVGEDKGVYFLHGLNLKDLSKTKNSYDYYTRIIPIGADGLTIEGINDGKNYLENYQYSNKVRPYIWVDESYTDAQALKEDAEWKLDDMSKPVVEYSAKVIDLAKQNQAYDILSYHLGDRVMLIDQDTGTREKQRIVKMTEYEQEPEKNTCELANTVLTFEEMQDRLQAAADIVGYTMTSDGKIHVSDILKWEEGVAGSQAVQGLSSSVSTLNGQYGALSLLVGTINANYLSAEQADLKYADIERLNAAEATVHSIQGDYAEFKTTVTDELSAQTAIIEALKASQITTEYLDAHYLNAEQADLKYATMESLNATNAAVGSLSAAQAEFESATAKNFEAQTATINDLKAAMITADYLVANYAQIDLANIKDGCITTAMIGQGVVGTVQIADSSITDAKIVELTANKITAGTLSVERLEIRGSKGSIVYALNNITGALQAENVNTLNGEVLTQRTITADKIVANAITANEIAAKTITANSGVIADLAITTAVIADAAITEAKIANLAVTNAKIANATIESAKIKSIDAAKITTGTLAADRIGAKSIDAGKLNVSTLSAIAANLGTVTAGTIRSATYTYSSGNFSTAGMEISLTGAGYIRAKNFAIDTSGNAYYNGTLDAGKITTGTLSVARLAAKSIKAEKIDINDLFAQNITATGTITGAKLVGSKFEVQSDLEESSNDPNYGRGYSGKPKINIGYEIELSIIDEKNSNAKYYTSLDWHGMLCRGPYDSATEPTFRVDCASGKVNASNLHAKNIYENEVLLSNKYALKSTVDALNTSITSNMRYLSNAEYGYKTIYLAPNGWTVLQIPLNNKVNVPAFILANPIDVNGTNGRFSWVVHINVGQPGSFTINIYNWEAVYYTVGFNYLAGF